MIELPLSQLPQFPPFQQWFIELVQILSNFFVGIAAIIGSFSIWKWRTETIGKARFEVARSMIRLTLRFRDEFKSTRNAYTRSFEWAARKKIDEESEKETHIRNEEYARNKRLKYLEEAKRELDEIAWEADTILTKSDAELIKPFVRAFEELSDAFQKYFQDQYGETQGRTPPDRNFTLTMHKKIYGLDDDELSTTVDNAVEIMKRQLNKYIFK